MTKKIVLAISCLLLIGASAVYSQEKYITKSGEIGFEASVSSFEPIKATNKGASAILNAESGELAALVLIRGFRFRVALMEEHFNENYLESQQYPKATFTGKLAGFSKNALANDKVLETTLKGQLTIKGRAKEVVAKASLKRTDGLISLHTSFIVAPSDFDIKIPGIVKNKIAERITIKVDLVLTKR